MTEPSRALRAFAAEVGDRGPVTVVGGRTQWDVGGPPAPGTREVRAPAGVVAFEPAEMTVRVGAGTTLAELDAALAEHGQCVALPDAPDATVGGVLSVGRSDVRRLGRGPVRDVLLEARYVGADGQLVKAGGPTVKNVSGFDLCRLLVGSLGTLGLLGEVVLRTRPRPPAAQWMRGPVDPFDLHRRLYRPSSILWDGAETWVLLEGRAGDVSADRRRLLAEGLADVDGPPPLPPCRASLDPAVLPRFRADGPWVAEVGVGIVHTTVPVPVPEPSEVVRALTRRVRAQFDPTGRLNPGRKVVAA